MGGPFHLSKPAVFCCRAKFDLGIFEDALVLCPKVKSQNGMEIPLNAIEHVVVSPPSKGLQHQQQQQQQHNTTIGELAALLALACRPIL